ncbi:hypothetical protein FACS1894111_03520 [Clostridia bacterium]|nr:hypothetical protein FACS1894111_03520 [Clostridia bacterium]
MMARRLGKCGTNERTKQASLSDRERVIFDQLQDDLSRRIFLARKEFTALHYDDFSETHATSHFEQYFFGTNECYCPLEKIRNILETDKCIIYGYGRTGKALLASIHNTCNITAIYDNNAATAQHPPTSLKDFPAFDYIVIAVLVPGFQREIIKELQKLGVDWEKILCPFVIDEENQYFDSDIIQLVPDEVFVDGGCFDFSTSARLLKLNPNVKKIYAYEPDPTNVKLVHKNAKKAGFTNVEIEELAWWKEETSLRFRSWGGASRKDENGTIAVNTKTIDNVVKEEYITFIKMDLEGAELEALIGAKETILRCRPKLAISIYHKPNDYYEIAEYIKSIVPQYRLFIRHYSSVNDDTVLYCVM